MKKILCGIGLTGFLFVVRAHDSWAPHTHTIDNKHSDFFLLCVVGAIGFATGAIAWRLRAKKRESQRAARRRFLT